MSDLQTEVKAGSDLIGQRQIRIQKVKKMRELGIDPFPSKAVRTHTNQEIVENYATLENQAVSVVGRVMLKRDHGSLMFMRLRDATGDIQLYLKAGELNEDLSVGAVEYIDSGDHIQADGVVTKTNTGEISILVKDLHMLSKSIRPMPTKFGGIEDKELKFRRRYLDMTLDPEVRHRFERRATFWKAVRAFLDDHGFYEVNIPVLEHTTGGADAKPFETYFDALGEKMYLRISHELPLKRLLGAGFEKVYDIGPRFRNEGYSDEHLPEHVALEWYWAYADYMDGIDFTKELFRYVINAVYGTTKFSTRGFEIDLADDWKVYDLTELIQERFSVNILDDSVETLYTKLLEVNPKIEVVKNRSRVADSLWKEIRPTMAGPAIIVGVPKYLSPLSKLMKSDPRKTERFFPVIAGSELANAFSELNDPLDQMDRFVEQQKLREDGDSEAHMLDVDFVEMLEYGMPPAVGQGISERAFWFFEDVTAKEGVPFPQMKFEFDNKTKEIYGDVYDFAAAEKETKRKPFAANPVSNAVSKGGKQDFTRKFVMLLNSELSGWKLTNTVGHITAYLGNRVGDMLLSRPNFVTVDEVILPANSQYPVISMSATNTQLINMYQKIKDAGLDFIFYIDEMTITSNDDQLEQMIAVKKLDEFTILGVGVFGKNEQIDAITKKFSLWK